MFVSLKFGRTTRHDLGKNRTDELGLTGSCAIEHNLIRKRLKQRKRETL